MNFYALTNSGIFSMTLLLASLISTAYATTSIDQQHFISCSNYTKVFDKYPNIQYFSAIGQLTGNVLNISKQKLQSEAYFCTEVTRNNHLYNKDFFDDLRNYIENSTNPSLSQFLDRAWIAFSSAYRDYSTLSELLEMYRHFNCLQDVNLYFYCFFTTMVISLIRYLITVFIFRPYCEKLSLPRRDVNKLISSLWLTLATTILWIQTLNVVILSGRTGFFEPLTILDRVRFEIGYFSDSLPTDYFWQYVIQISFYLSAVINLFFLDYWREDKPVITLHHIVTISLLFISFNTKLHEIGSITLLLHDINDIFLELGKVNVYLKFKYKRYNPINDTLATICYILFMASWALTRLYWYPFKVLYACTWGAYITHIGREMFFFFELNFLLWLLLFMHFYWSYLILTLAFKIVTGRMKNLGDIRETDIDYEKDPEIVLKDISNDKKVD